MTIRDRLDNLADAVEQVDRVAIAIKRHWLAIPAYGLFLIRLHCSERIEHPALTCYLLLDVQAKFGLTRSRSGRHTLHIAPAIEVGDRHFALISIVCPVLGRCSKTDSACGFAASGST
jgi:hypothetical protein